MRLGDVGWAAVARALAMRTLRVEVLGAENVEVFSAGEPCLLKRKEKGEDPSMDGGTEVHEDPGWRCVGGSSEEIKKLPCSSR